MASKQRGDVAQMKGALNFFLKTHKLLKGFLKKLKDGENLQIHLTHDCKQEQEALWKLLKLKKRTIHKRQVINCEEEFLMLYFGFVGRPVHVRG